MKMSYPCKGCSKCRDCDGHGCAEWEHWFRASWARLTKGMRKLAQR